MTYREFCNLKGNDPMENIFPKGTTAEEAMSILEETFVFFDDHELFDSVKDHISLNTDYPTITKLILCNITKRLTKKKLNHYVNIIDDNATARECLDVLDRELLPENWYVTYPAGGGQGITETVAYILYLYNNPDKKKGFIDKLKSLFK